MLYQYCCKMNLLKQTTGVNETGKRRKVIHLTTSDPRKRVNAASLARAYAVSNVQHPIDANSSFSLSSFCLFLTPLHYYINTGLLQELLRGIHLPSMPPFLPYIDSNCLLNVFNEIASSISLCASNQKAGLLKISIPCAYKRPFKQNFGHILCWINRQQVLHTDICIVCPI